MDYICYPPTISGINLSGTSLALLARRARVAVSMVARIAVIGILISAVLGGLLVSYVFNSPTPELRPTEDVLTGGECSFRNAASNQFIREFVVPVLGLKFPILLEFVSENQIIPISSTVIPIGAEHGVGITNSLMN